MVRSTVTKEKKQEDLTDFYFSEIHKRIKDNDKEFISFTLDQPFHFIKESSAVEFYFKSNGSQSLIGTLFYSGKCPDENGNFIPSYTFCPEENGLGKHLASRIHSKRDIEAKIISGEKE